MSSQDHVILNHLDAPARILFWPISEFIFVMFPLVLLVGFGYPFFGIVICIGVGLMVRKFKQRFGKGVLEGFLYWYSIHNVKNYPTTPPSYIREYIE